MKKKIILSLCLLFTTLNANNFKNLAQLTQYNNNASQTKQDSLKAFKWHHKSAIKGNRASQYQLALMFHYGAGVRKNFELARLWFTRASKKGHPKAQSILYRFYSAKQPQYYSTRRVKYSRNFRR